MNWDSVLNTVSLFIFVLLAYFWIPELWEILMGWCDSWR